MMERVTEPVGGAVPSEPVTDAATLKGPEQEGKCRAGFETATPTCGMAGTTSTVTVTGVDMGVNPPVLLPEVGKKIAVVHPQQSHVSILPCIIMIPRNHLTSCAQISLKDSPYV